MSDEDVCTQPVTSFHDGHTFRMGGCTATNEKWQCIGCGKVEYRDASTGTRRLLRALNAAARVGRKGGGE